MNLRYARTFVTVAELGTVSKAATRLRIAQPALSRQISAFEQELGLKLFDRVGSRLVLTGEGEQLLERLPRSVELRERAGRAGATAPARRHRRVEGRDVAANHRRRAR